MTRLAKGLQPLAIKESVDVAPVAHDVIDLRGRPSAAFARADTTKRFFAQDLLPKRLPARRVIEAPIAPVGPGALMGLRV